MDSDFKPAGRPAKSSKAEQTDLDKTKNNFITPDQAAAEDDGRSDVIADESGAVNLDMPAGPEKPKNSGNWKDKLRLSWPPGKKEYITAAVIVVLIAAGVAGYFLFIKKDKPADTVKVQKAKTSQQKKPTTVASTLSGLQVDPSVNQRPVTGVMIENSLDARPQSGLAQASVVFEAIAEGGITRFLALYQDTQPDNIGPVRSARPYYEQWVLGFDAGYAHVGGSPEALADIKAWGVRDLDQFYNSGAYHRIGSRAAPHNVYTSISALNQLETSKGYTSSNFNGFVRKPAETPAKVPAAKSINFDISGPLYNVHYDYSQATNSYNRSEGGAPHMDADSNTQISPKVVIAMVMPYSLEADGYHSDYNTIGSGPVYVFQDGAVITGTWSKTSNQSQFSFKDANGQTIPLDPGPTWLTALGSASDVGWTQ
jgi:hypothetical protein